MPRSALPPSWWTSTGSAPLTPAKQPTPEEWAKISESVGLVYLGDLPLERWDGGLYREMPGKYVRLPYEFF